MADGADRDLSADDVYEEMDVLEPYTAGELAARFEAPKRRVRALLERLSGADRIRKKEPEPERTIWIREAPINECADCGFRYEVKVLHPVLSSVRYCPQCGSRL